ncbi:uncharacterized protein LOC124927720 [Impatiens glandulifera]|uniref:uncharacterized protein LOC124927718 n=1 Tax=Impatiens glandulifera TaxID=253017 RepID=UPI001FB08B48|nr:uncharacterized protein LOC124927718 [Impatiens glandulifera]XP_047324133.1 uncharacterized protein LOC124927720 [Impatiens glandulifera]
MAPNRETLMGSYKTIQKPEKLSLESIRKTKSDISSELQPVLEVEEAKCECCTMSEECSSEYINGVRAKFAGRFVCGLCAEAVGEEAEKNGGKREEAVEEHVRACTRFNRIERAYPVLYQAEAMREILKRSNSLRAKSISPRDKGVRRKGGIERSSSCIPAILNEKEMNA